LNKFLIAIGELLGKTIECEFTNRMPAGKFPFLYEEEVQSRKEGVYIFSSIEDGKILYIGKSVDVVNRFWDHKGTNFKWEKDGHSAEFPNCQLTDQRHWLDDKIQKIFQNAQFEITFIFPNYTDVKGLIEVYLIYYAKPPINVDNKI